MAVVRYPWMFRTAAIVFLLLGGSWLWTFGLTDYRPQYRLVGLALGVLALIIGIFLFRHARFAIALSAAGAALVSISAALFAPIAHGPVILFLGVLAIVCGIYTVLALRVLFTRAAPPA